MYLSRLTSVRQEVRYARREAMFQLFLFINAACQKPDELYILKEQDLSFLGLRCYTKYILNALQSVYLFLIGAA
jgi:hypothetical protein